MNKETLILEQITDKNTKLVKSKIVLYANDDGKVYLLLPTTTLRVTNNQVMRYGEIYYLSCDVGEDVGRDILYPLDDTQVDDIDAFFNYWTDKRLLEIKQAKWNSFCEYWQIVFNFVEDNIDLSSKNVSYEYHSSHYDYEDGDVLNYFDIHLGENYFGSKEELGDSYYHNYFDMSDELQAILIDNYLENKDGLRWFSAIHVQFKP